MERYQAIANLYDAHCLEAGPPLLELLLEERSEDVCCAAVLALAELGSPECLEALHQQATQDECPRLRERAIWALGYRGDPASLPVLHQLLLQDGDARQAAARAVALSQGGPVPTLPLNEREEAAEARDREEAAGYLEILQASDDPDQRVVAAEALSQIASTPGAFPELVDPLLNALADPLEEVRECAAQALLALSVKSEPPPVDRLLEVFPQFPALAAAAGHWGLTEVVPLLLEWSQDSNRFLAEQACQSLARLKDPRAEALMVQSVGDRGRSTSTRILAAEFLASQPGSTSLVALLDALRAIRPGEDGELIRALAHALGSLGHPDAVPALIEAYNRNQAAAQKKRPTDFLARRDCEEHFYQNGLTIVEALGRIGDTRAEELLVTELRESLHAVIRSTAALALTRFPSSQAELEQALRDHQPRVVMAAQQALAGTAT